MICEVRLFCLLVTHSVYSPGGRQSSSPANRDGTELDLVTHDVLKFFTLLLKRNGYVLEQLYSPLVVHSTPEHEELKDIAHGCLTRRHSHHYLGFAATQWRLFMKDDPPCVKPLLYVYPVLLTGIHLTRSGEIEANLLALNQQFHLPYVSELVARKVSGSERGVLDSTERKIHASEYNRLVAELAQAALDFQAARCSQRQSRSQRPPDPDSPRPPLSRLTPLIRPDFQHGQERLLRNLYPAHALHPALAFLLFFE